MISLRDAIAPAGHRWERALFLCYEANLPFLERTLLLDLQRGGTGAVSILVDRRDLEQSYADANAVSGVGVNYSFEGATLPKSTAAFHSKVYLLFGSEELRLIVTSGNLTSGGLGRNLEIVDVLSLDRHGAGDRNAFEGVADFLAELPQLCVGLGSRALEELRTGRRLILERLQRSGTASSNQPFFLHNAVTPMLQQLVGAVPHTEVAEITIVSPFYDRQSRALIELAQAYPEATVRIIKSGTSYNDFNGQALAILGENRIRIERLCSVDGIDRRLHAKTALLVGPRRHWLVQGSANMSAPAWLVAARNGGNLETVTLRSVEVKPRRDGNGHWQGMIAQLHTERLALSELNFELPESPPQNSSMLQILSATVASGALVVECRVVQSDVPFGQCAILLSDRERSAALTCEIVENSSAKLTLRATISGDVGEDLALSDNSVLVTLSVVSLDGSNHQARTWLEKPEYLRLSVAARERRHAMALMTRQMFVQDVHLYRVAEFIVQTALAMSSELRSLGAAPTQGETRWVTAPQNVDKRTPTEVDSDVDAGDVDWDALIGADSGEDDGLDPEFFELEQEIGDTGSTSRGRALASPLNRLDDYLSECLSVVNGMFGAPDSIRTPRRTRVPSSRTEELAPEIESTLEAADPDGDEMLRSAAEQIYRASVQLRRTPPSDASLERIANTFLVLVAHLYRLELHAQLWQSPAVIDIQRYRSAVWRSAWDLNGWETGRCSAWMPRAWSVPRFRQPMHEVVADPMFLSQLLLVASASWGLDGSGSRVPEEIVAGIGLVCGTTIPVGGRLASELRQRADGLAIHSLAGVDSSEVLDMLRSASPMQMEGSRKALNWSPLHQLLSGEDLPVGKIEEVLTRLGEALGDHSGKIVREVRRRLVRKLFGTVQNLAGKPSCGYCKQSLPTAFAQQLSRGDGAMAVCEACGALLIPLAWGDPLCRAILSEATMLGTSA